MNFTIQGLGILATGKVEKLFKKLIFPSGEKYVLVEMLLSVDQVWVECPNMNTLYMNMDSLLRYRSIEILLHNVTLIVSPPVSVPVVDPSTNSPQKLTVPVSIGLAFSVTN